MDLHRYNQWLNWNYKNGNKVPLNQWGSYSGSTRVSDYMDSEAAMQAAEKNQNHLAFCFTRSDPFIGIDFDDCLLPDGTVKDWAAPHVQALCCTYGEVSPSKTGIKFYGYGSISDDVRKQYNIGDGQIEIYCHGRFFCFTGWRFHLAFTEISNIQGWVDNFVAANKPQVQSIRPTNGTTPYVVVSDLQVRVRSYLDRSTRPGADSRMRNKTVFSLAGHCFAMRSDTGEAPNIRLVMQEIMHWNQSLEEPLDQEEVVRCVENAACKGTPREAKESVVHVPNGAASSSFSDDFFQPTATVHVLQIEPDGDDEEDIEYDDAKRYKFSAIPSHLLDVPGLVNSTIKYMSDTALYPQPELFAAAAICMQSGLSSRKVMSDLLGARPHVYCCSIAPSGAGKEHGREVVKMILGATGLAGTLLGTEELASGAGLLKSMEAHPSNIIQYDEFGRLLTAITRQGAQHFLSDIGTKLITLHTLDRTTFTHNGYADVERNFSIIQPGLVLHGTTVPGHFLNGLSAESLSDGLLSRIAVWFGSYVVPVDPPVDLYNDPIPEEIMERVKWWGDHWERTGMLQGSSSQFDPQPILIRSTPETRRAWMAANFRMAKQAKQAVESGGGLLGEAAVERACYSRCVERAVRFALVRVCSACRDVMVPEDLEWGMELSETLIRRLLVSVGSDRAENAYHSTVHRIHDVIRDAGPDGISNRELHRKTQGIDTDSRKKILSGLIDAGQILRIEIGRSRQRSNGESTGVQKTTGYVAIRAKKQV